MGFTTHRVDDYRYDVQHAGITVATIVGDQTAEIELNADGITQVAPILSPLTDELCEKLAPLVHRIDLDAIAVHEAGHAVAAHELNRQFCYVRLSVTDNELAWCKEDGPDALDYSGDPKGVIEVQTVLAAGVAAEKLLFGWHREDGCKQDRVDIQGIEILKRDRYGDGDETEVGTDVLDEYVPLANAILTPDKVRAVADALKEKSFLSRVEIEDILENLE